MMTILGLLALACAQEPRAPGHWPQWRGPSRDNVSKETGLLKEWPEGGPPVAWEVHGIGGGIAAVTVAGGRVFTIGYIGDAEHLSALDEQTGKRLWAARVGPLVQENPLMRWLGQRTPTVDGDRVYAFHRNETRLLCYEIREAALREERPRPKAIVLDPPGGRSQPLPPAQAIYVPTPQDVVEKMLETAGVGKEDVVYDLGSGDGRIVVTAARKHGARAFGYEIDGQLVRDSRANVEKAGVKDLASIELKDMFTVDLAPASVIAVYLPEKFLERLMPQFEKLKPGSRIVSHQFKIPGVAPDKALRVDSKDDGDTHAIYLWTTPLKKEGK